MVSIQISRHAVPRPVGEVQDILTEAEAIRPVWRIGHFCPFFAGTPLPIRLATVAIHSQQEGT
jgi:hypothetical protein